VLGWAAAVVTRICALRGMPCRDVGRHGQAGPAGSGTGGHMVARHWGRPSSPLPLSRLGLSSYRSSTAAYRDRTQDTGVAGHNLQAPQPGEFNLLQSGRGKVSDGQACVTLFGLSVSTYIWISRQTSSAHAPTTTSLAKTGNGTSIAVHWKVKTDPTCIFDPYVKKKFKALKKLGN
jgi:hypothetical protein